MIRRAMYDQEEEASRGAVQGWTNCFPPPARGDDNIQIYCFSKRDQLIREFKYDLFLDSAAKECLVF